MRFAMALAVRSASPRPKGRAVMMTVRVCVEPISLPPNRCSQRKETMATRSVMRSQHAQSGCVSRHVPKAVIQQDTLSDCRNSATRYENIFGRLTDWRRLALHYERCAHSVVSAIGIAATGIFWLSFTRPDPSAWYDCVARRVVVFSANI